MNIPVLYDLMWIIFPLVLVVLASSVFFSEKRSGNSIPRSLGWSIVQFLVPIVGFVVWIVFRAYERRVSSSEI